MNFHLCIASSNQYCKSSIFQQNSSLILQNMNIAHWLIELKDLHMFYMKSLQTSKKSNHLSNKMNNIQMDWAFYNYQDNHKIFDHRWVLLCLYLRYTRGKDLAYQLNIVCILEHRKSGKAHQNLCTNFQDKMFYHSQ